VVDEEFAQKQEQMCGYAPYVTREDYWSFKRESGSDSPSPRAWGEMTKKLKPLFAYVAEDEDLSQTVRSSYFISFSFVFFFLLFLLLVVTIIFDDDDD